MALISIDVAEEEVKEASKCLDDLFAALPKKKQGEYLYELNQLGLLIGKVRRGLKDSADTTN